MRGRCACACVCSFRLERASTAPVPSSHRCRTSAMWMQRLGRAPRDGVVWWHHVHHGSENGHGRYHPLDAAPRKGVQAQSHSRDPTAQTVAHTIMYRGRMYDDARARNGERLPCVLGHGARRSRRVRRPIAHGEHTGHAVCQEQRLLTNHVETLRERRRARAGNPRLANRIRHAQTVCACKRIQGIRGVHGHDQTLAVVKGEHSKDEVDHIQG